MLPNIVEKAERILSCSSCQWDQFCIKPPTMTEAEVRSHIDEEKPKQGMDKEAAAGSMMASIMSMALFSGKDTTCPACSKFIKELRKDDALIRKIKALMKESC